MAHHPEILIVGGGVIGLTTAYYLAREGARVEVVDQGDLGQQASWAGAGILPPAVSRPGSSPMEQLHARSFSLHATLANELREVTGIDNGYQVCGGLEFIDGQSEEESEWHAVGVAVEKLDERHLLRLEPGLALRCGSAYHIPGMAQVRNPRHLKALIAACQGLGVALTPGCPVHGFERKDSRVLAAKTGLGNKLAGQILLAAGAWTESLLDLLGWRPGIHPVRGQIVLLAPQGRCLQRILLCGARYLVPRADGKVLIGSTEEHAGFVRQTTAEAVAGLLQLGCQIVPSLAQAPVERSWAGLRPGSADGMPYLGAVPDWKNLAVASGHFRSGILLSPVTGWLMKELLLGQPPSLNLGTFRLDRAPQRS